MRGGMLSDAVTHTARAAWWIAGAAVIAIGCASVGVHPAPLATVQLPPGFEGTWVRRASIALVSSAGSVKPPALPDTLRLGAVLSYRPDSVIPELSDSIMQAILASPFASTLAATTDLQGHAPPTASTADVVTTAKLHGDTVVVVSKVSSPDAGLIAQSTTREYLSPDKARLFFETTTINALRDAQLRSQGLPPGTPGPARHVVVYDRVR